MKKNSLSIFVLLLSCYTCYPQLNNNAIKINLSGLVVRNISVQYERKVSHKISLALGFRDLPFGTLPFSKAISNLVDNPNVQFNRMNIGSIAVTPELRFYPGKKPMKGFYVGPFISFANYKTDLPIEYNTKTGFFKGSVKTITGGLQVGSQFRLTKNFFLDWWILGPNFGGSSGALTFTGALSANEQIILAAELEQIKKDVPFNFIETYNVDNNGAMINIKGPWAGLRGLGINLVYQF